jgi:hypothetical protein
VGLRAVASSSEMTVQACSGPYLAVHFSVMLMWECFTLFGETLEQVQCNGNAFTEDFQYFNLGKMMGQFQMKKFFSST